jgi:uncharacterized membrane protein
MTDIIIVPAWAVIISGLAVMLIGMLGFNKFKSNAFAEIIMITFIMIGAIALCAGMGFYCSLLRIVP